MSKELIELVKELRKASRLFRPIEHKAADAIEHQAALIKQCWDALQDAKDTLEANFEPSDYWMQKTALAAIKTWEKENA